MKRRLPKGCIYVTNPRHPLYTTGSAFFIQFKTNAGYMVRYCGEWFTIPLKDAYEL